jgi:hypothetical protein
LGEVNREKKGSITKRYEVTTEAVLETGKEVEHGLYSRDKGGLQKLH